jgi:hypothetical protein
MSVCRISYVGKQTAWTGVNNLRDRGSLMSRMAFDHICARMSSVHISAAMSYVRLYEDHLCIISEFKRYTFPILLNLWLFNDAALGV